MIVTPTHSRCFLKCILFCFMCSVPVHDHDREECELNYSESIQVNPSYNL